MPRWLTYTLLATVLWGIWGAVSALVSREASPLVTQVISTLGVVPTALVLFLSPNWKQGTNFKLGILFAALTGLCANTGNLCLLRAFRLEGPVSVVLPVSSLYPLVTALLAILFLRERLNRIQAVGFAMALVAIYIAGIATPGASASEGLHDLRVAALTTPWMLWTFGALVLFGATCFFQKIATFHFSSELCTLVFALVTIPIAGAILLFGPDLSFKLSGKVWLLSLLFGALVGIGSLAQFAAYRWGKGSVVTALTGLYPAITVLLAVPLLKEKLDALRIIAVVVALAAGVALTYEPGQTSTMEADVSSV
ncbi:MAG: EamA family transporter [Methyloceanibacter sp.]